MRTIRRDWRSTTSTSRASLPVSDAHHTAIADGDTSSSRTIAPSALDTTFCATTNTSPGSTGSGRRRTASTINAARSAPRPTSGSAPTPRMCKSTPMLAVGVDFVRRNLHDQPHFAGRTERIAVLAEILFRHLVDVRVAAGLGHLDDAALDAEVAIRIVGVGNRHRDARFARQVPGLHPPLGGV